MDKSNDHIEQIKSVMNRENELIKNQVAAISLDVKMMMEFVTKQYGQNPPKEVIDDLYDQISNIKVGQTGYVFILDAKGNYVVSKDRVRDGENIWGAKDANGRLFIQEMVNEGRKLTKDEIYPIAYPWQNIGEDNHRMKLAGISYFKDFDVIIGASSYYSDFLSEDLENQLKEELKDKISKQTIGETGYIWVLNSEGDYVVSKDRARDGENIWEAKDANGVLFIQSMIKNSKLTKEGESYIHYYPWQNKDESTSRMKLAAVTYVPKWDWIIGPSAYHSEFLIGLNKIKSSIIIIGLIAIILGSIIAYFLAIKITKPITIITNQLRDISDGEGDLTKRINVSGDNEVGKLAKYFNKFIAQQEDMIKKIISISNASSSSAQELSALAEEVNASTEQVSNTVQDISKSSQELSSSSKDTKIEIEQLTDSIQSISTSSIEASTDAKLSSEAAKKGSGSAKIAEVKMSAINLSVTKSAELVSNLGDKTKEINKVIGVINTISEQTNLLALNAAIEAARAGEAGKGFAVVADEVRTLAEETKKATKQIEDIIISFNDSTNESVESMNKGRKEVEEGSQVITEALGSLEIISQKIISASTKIEIISKATTNQLESANKVQKSVSNVSNIAERSATGSEEVSASVEEVTSSMQQVANTAQKLSMDSNELNKLVSQCKVN